MDSDFDTTPSSEDQPDSGSPSGTANGAADPADWRDVILEPRLRSFADRFASPADAVKGGTAIDHRGRIFVSLENGKLLCFSPKP